MDILRNMKIFVRVAEIASFTVAAQQLEVTTAQASRAISELEVHLRTRLLNRTTRRVALTDAGNRYLIRCKEILGLIEHSEAEAEAGDAKDTPSGVLRIHAPLSFGHIYVIPALAEYLEANPRVRGELTLSQRIPDLLDEGYDVSFQITTAHLQDSALVSARICTMPGVLCASPRYIERHGTPATVAALLEHACLQFVTPYFPVDHWKFETPGGVEEIDLPPGKLRVNSPDALAGALARGMGIGALPMLSALPLLRSGELVHVLPECKLQEMTIYAVYASREYLDAKIRTWIAFLREHVTAALAAAHA
ncbi:LysR family transcriptional regulator [Paraburkholderia sartisoli]|uniref:DNA-binding transcriptional regulator, LysR family n=1 Tax=Paraburkholderia sartisoli TaxID=83784 RepID=A0A1H4GPN1_9BURK|nr:LysR family transcriptional regulator [Paraburkholderia sartisoli]SEB10582.1 DNA-binding transcriptional regulator, LysR family [Paraburkholderia sartisoli]